MAALLSPILFLLLLLSIATAGGDVHLHDRYDHQSPLPNLATSATPSSQFRQACNATRYPDVCELTLSQSRSLPPNPSTVDLILAAADASTFSIQTARSMIQSILNASEKASNLNRTNAARNCLEFLSYSDRRLSAALHIALPADAFADARAWASAALLYQYDCWSALRYVNGTTQVSDAMDFLLVLGNETSNVAAMLAALQRYGSDTALWGPPQTERDGYWADHVVSSNSSSAAPGAGSQDLRPDFTVCKDKGCKYQTVQAAVDAAPEWSTRRILIHIKTGVYNETVRVPFEKINLEFVGDGMGKTVITGSLNAGMVGGTTFGSATVGVSGDGFRAGNLTIANTASSYQAVAFRSDSDQSVIDGVELLGHQDTLYAHSLRQFYRNCRVAGTVDFVFGNSATVFDNCHFLFRPRVQDPEKGETNIVTAHGRTDPAQSTGFVFHRCVVNGTEDYLALYNQKPAVHKAYLGRPWKEYSRVVFIDTHMEAMVRPEGWSPWTGDFALKTLFYGEYKSSGPGANAAARVPWSNQIPAEHVGAYSLENFIQGDKWIGSH